MTVKDNTVKDNIEVICDILEGILEGYDKKDLLEMLEKSGYITYGSDHSALEMRLSMKGFKFLMEYRGYKKESEKIEEVLEEMGEKLEEANNGV